MRRRPYLLTSSLLAAVLAPAGVSQTPIPIQYGSATAASLAVGAVHTYQFQGTAGEKIVILASATGSNSGSFDPCVELLDASGTRLGRKCTTAATNRLNFQLTSTGAHQILVSDHPGTVRAGNYTLALERVFPTASPNATAIAFGQTIPGIISPDGELDTYRFAVRGNVPIRLTVSETGSNSGSFDPCIELYGPSGAVAGTACSTAGTNVLNYTTGLPGTYVMIVLDHRGTVRGGTYSIALQCLAATCASTASYAPFGAGCAGTAGVPVLAAANGSTPMPGAAFTVELTGLPTSTFLNVPVMFLGASDTIWSGTPLPYALISIGMPGCDLLVSPDYGTPLTNSNGMATWTVLVPLDAGLIGGTFFNQGFVVDLGANAAGVVASNGGRGVIG